MSAPHPKLARGWIAELSPTTRATVDDRGAVVLTKHGSEVTVLNPSEARKLIDAWLETRRLAGR